ncbi:unnamed protein product [Adineta steineri]|uniref:F-box domain-containing protein n=1 Tax=Adineta steineri TaxID=433720 RepID=A0A815SQV8_9BILA|nr:unnamed protein product [Adineta steineri]CAF4072647.1 unnamed protein product [Adineta steineri]
MKFESIPNEIFIEIFEFLSIFDIFYSFNQLNDHFNELIRTIPLHLNFKYIQKSTFDRFCKFLLTNPDVKNQVYSLKLSNKDTCGQINEFLSFFSLDEFIHLHSLTLIQVKENSLQKLKSILPLIPQLHSFHLLDSNDIQLTYPLPSNLQILTIPTLSSIDKLSSITNLTISGCSIDQLLNHLFKYAPMLTYLNIQYLSSYYSTITNYSNVNFTKAVHLKELVISNFQYKFEDLKCLVKYIPKLITLKFTGTYDLDMIDANQWESLIKSSLSCLETFKFIFNYIYKPNDNHMEDRFNQFQTDFWIKQHQWHTEYSLSNHSALIYTVPYMLNSYKLDIDSNRYSNQLINTLNNVKNLTLYRAPIRETWGHCFSNVISLTILPPEYAHRPSLGTQAIRLLQPIVNLSNLQHLNISLKFKIKDSHAFLRILQDLPKLSSLTISVRALEQFAYNKELCEYLNKVIKKLDIYKYHSSSFKFHYQIEEFCKIFSNIEELKCNIDQQNDLLFLLKHLPKLSILKAYLWKINDHDYFYSWFKKQTNKLNLLFDVNYIDKYETELMVWINRNIN